ALDFYLWIGSAGGGSDANDRFHVYIDSTPLFTSTALQAGSYLTYTLVSLNVAAFANGSPHVVQFVAITNDQRVDFNLDDLALCADAIPTSTPTLTPTSAPGNFKIYLPVAMHNYFPID